MAVTIINKRWFEENRNEKAELSPFGRFVDYSGKTPGAYQELQGLKKTAKLVHEFLPSQSLKVFESSLATGSLIFTRLPGATSDAMKSLSGMVNEGEFVRMATKAVRDVLDAISAYGYAAVFITGNFVVLTAAQILELVSDITDLQLSIADYNKASELEPIATGEAGLAVAHSKNYFSLRILKDIASIAAAVIGFSAIAAGAPLMPTTALLIVFLSTTVFSILRDVYKDMGQYKIINFDKPVQLTIV